MAGHPPHSLRRSVTGYDPDGRPVALQGVTWSDSEN